MKMKMTMEKKSQNNRRSPRRESTGQTLLLDRDEPENQTQAPSARNTKRFHQRTCGSGMGKLGRFERIHRVLSIVACVGRDSTPRPEVFQDSQFWE